MKTAPADRRMTSVDLAWMRRFAARLVADGDLADDLVQETWLSAWRHPPAGTRLRPWLAEVLRNHLRDRLRSDRRRAARHAAAGPEGLAAAAPLEETVAARERLERLHELVERLEEPLRTAVRLRHGEGLSAAAIAARTGVPAGTVRWRLAAARARLRAALGLDDEARPSRALCLAPATAAPSALTFVKLALSTALAPALVVAALALTPGPAPRGARAAAVPRATTEAARGETPRAGAAPAGAAAEPPAPAPPRGRPRAPRPTPSLETAAPTRIDFDADEVKGALQRPDGERIGAPTPVRHPSLIELRTDFLPETCQVADDV